MLGHVSHTRVLEAVFADPGADETSNWSELRRLLGEIIDTFRWSGLEVPNLRSWLVRYETQLLESSSQVVHEERAALVSLRSLTCDTRSYFWPQVRRLVNKRLRGLSCNLTKCAISGQPFKGSGRIAVFPCKHAFCTSALDRAGGLTLSSIGEEVGQQSIDEISLLSFSVSGLEMYLVLPKRRQWNKVVWEWAGRRHWKMARGQREGEEGWKGGSQWGSDES